MQTIKELLELYPHKVTAAQVKALEKLEETRGIRSISHEPLPGDIYAWLEDTGGRSRIDITGEIFYRKWANIVFIQGNDPELDKLLEEREEDQILEYLKQWDYGSESETDLRDDSGAGSMDHVKRCGEYELNINYGLGYAGLERIIEVQE